MVEHAKPEKLALPALAPAPPLSKEPEPSQRGLRARLGRLHRLLPAQLAVAHRVHLSYVLQYSTVPHSTGYCKRGAEAPRSDSQCTRSSTDVANPVGK